MRLQGKTAIITGAGSGIGEASAKMFAAEGARLVIVDSDQEGGRRVAREVGDSGFFVRADVSQAGDVEAMTRTAVERFGRIDILFNNAGVSSVGAVHEVSEQEWDRVMAVNIKGIYLACKYVVPVMMEQKSGCILNMASGAAIMGLAQRAVYSASKGAVIAATKSAAKELASRNIRVNAIAPGYIETDMSRATPPETHRQRLASIPSGRIGTPDDVADTALFLASDLSRYVTGQVIGVDGGMVI